MASDATLLVTLLREILPILIVELRQLRNPELHDLEEDALVTLALDRTEEKARQLRPDSE